MLANELGISHVESKKDNFEPNQKDLNPFLFTESSVSNKQNARNFSVNSN